MITASTAFNTANAKRQKKPAYIIQIQDYPRAFSNHDLDPIPPLPPKVSGLPAWIVPPSAPVTGEKLLWWPVTGAVTLDQGNAYPTSGNVAGSGTAITLTRLSNSLGYQSPSATWSAPIMATPSVAGASITRIYGIARGSYGGIWGNALIHSPTESSDLVNTVTAFDGAVYTELARGLYHSLHTDTFPWSTFDLVMTLGGSTSFTGTSIFQLTDLGFLIYYDSAPPKSIVYPWLVSIEDHAITINDLDGGADLADLVFNVQDRGGAITSDFPGFVFEGNKVVLSHGFEGMDFADFVVMFTGRVDSIESANANMEYVFTCPDVRQELTKVIYGVGDDGFATDSKHPRTLNANPLDILLSVLETEVGLDPADIDVAKIEQYRDTLYSGVQFQFSITSPPAAKDFIENELMKPLGAYIWPNNLGQVTVNFYYPLNPTPVFDFSPDNLIEIPEAGPADLINEVSIRFDYDSSDSPKTEIVRQDAASVAKFGLFGQHIIEAKGLRSGLQGAFLASLTAFLIFLRYSFKQLMFGSSNSGNGNASPINALWDACLVEPGDIVTLTHPLVPDRNAGVMGVTGKTFVVMDRTWQFFECLVQFKLLEIDTSKFKQYLITGNAEGDYTTVSGTDQGKYMFQSGDDDKYSNGNSGNTLA